MSNHNYHWIVVGNSSFGRDETLTKAFKNMLKNHPGKEWPICATPMIGRFPADYDGEISWDHKSFSAHDGVEVERVFLVPEPVFKKKISHFTEDSNVMIPKY